LRDPGAVYAAAVTLASLPSRPSPPRHGGRIPLQRIAKCDPLSRHRWGLQNATRARRRSWPLRSPASITSIKVSRCTPLLQLCGVGHPGFGPFPHHGAEQLGCGPITWRAVTAAASGFAGTTGGWHWRGRSGTSGVSVTWWHRIAQHDQVHPQACSSVGATISPNARRLPETACSIFDTIKARRCRHLWLIRSELGSRLRMSELFLMPEALYGGGR
jgi:hypothetical protein